jgi:hypothetical protein
MEGGESGLNINFGSFLDANLRSKPMSLLLTKTSPQYSEAALTTSEQALCGARGRKQSVLCFTRHVPENLGASNHCH